MDTREQIEEKIRNNQPFRVLDDLSLFEDMMAGAEKCFALNQLRPTQWEERRAAFKDLFGTLGERLMLFTPFYCQYGTNITLGDDVTINLGAQILDMSPVTIGSNTMIGPFCGFYAGNHSIDPEERNNLICTPGAITIGESVWLGGHTIVMAGVTIGDNSVIGAGSVVTKDIPANVIAAGNPCRVIRPIGPQDRVLQSTGEAADEAAEQS